MDFWNSLNGMLQVEMTSADPEKSLGELSESGIELYRISYLSDMTVLFQIKRRSLKQVQKQCEKHGNTLTMRNRQGIYWLIRRFTGRPVLLVGCILYLLLVLYLPSRIFFVQVEGNTAVPTKRIVEAADAAGIRFGASRREVRSERIKNLLLGAVPELQWAGVNTFGCTAVISVRERSLSQTEPAQTGISNIVAAADGRVYACTSVRGTLLCEEGDMVQKGQVLISGYTDCGLCIQAGQAEGEIYAQTNRTHTAVTPVNGIKIRSISSTSKKYSLLLGKKRINLWKDSGNCDSSCGRMYEEYYITLPGGFQLPFGIAVDTELVYETELFVRSESEAEALLSEAARRAVNDSMVAGTILQETVQMLPDETHYRLVGSYVCTEMIGRVRQERIGENYGENN